MDFPKNGQQGKEKVADPISKIYQEREAHLIFEQDAEEIMDKNIAGRIDILSPDSLFEIKVPNLRDTHLLQAIVYAWLTRTKRSIYVYNIKTDECQQIKAIAGLSLSGAEECTHYLLKQKYKPHNQLSDQDFQALAESCQEGKYGMTENKKINQQYLEWNIVSKLRSVYFYLIVMMIRLLSSAYVQPSPVVVCFPRK